MLNLQNILAIFSITETELKFSVVEKSVDTKNIIFHQATKNNNVYTINETLGENPIFVKMFKELINRAEKNIGMPITKVVIFVEDDDTFSITKTSKTFNLYGNVVTLEKAKELLGELSIDNVEKKTHVFSNINKWTIDGKVFYSTPENISGQTLSYEYSLYYMNKNLVTNLNEMCSKLKIEVTSYVSDFVLFNFELAKDNTTDTFVKIKNNKTLVCKNHQVTTLDVGFNCVLQNIQKKVPFISTQQIYKLLENFSNKQNNDSLPLALVYDDEYLKYTEFSTTTFVEICQLVLKSFTKTLMAKISSSIQQTNKVIIQCSEHMEYLTNIAKNVELNNVVFVKTHNKRLFNINVEEIYNIYELIIKKFVDFEIGAMYSVSESISYEELNTNMFLRNFLLKLGIISTKFAAKLGE